MKKNNVFRYLAPIVGISLAFMVGLLINALFAGVSGVVMGMALAAGTYQEGDPVSHEVVDAAASELNTAYVSKKVAEMRPAATPLDTIMRNIGKSVKMNSFKTEFYSVDSREFSDTVATAYTKSNDGHTSTALVVDNVGMWSVDDTCIFSGITGAQDSGDLVCLIIAKSASANTITIQPLNGDTGAGTNEGSLVLPTIAEDTVIVRAGKAMNELDAQAEPFAIIPEKSFNYAQIFMAQVEEGTFQAMHSQEVEFGFKDYSAQNVYDMRGSTEFSYLFGYKSLTTHLTDTKERHTCGGITREITSSLTYGTGGVDRTVNESDFVTWTKDIFTGNSGSEARVFFVGDSLMSYISQIDTISKQQKANSTEVKWGVKFNKVETNFGTLLIKHHPGLDLANWGEKGIVLDMNYVEKHVFKPMTIEKLDLKTSGTRNVIAEIMQECSCPVIRYPDVHRLVAPAA